VAVHPIRFLGDPVLREKARRVTQFDDDLQRLIDDMFESMYAARGVGLAAPQIGVPLRVVVIHAPEHPPFVLINPEIIRRSGSRRVEEGCLSVPGYRGEITRSVSVTAKGLDRDGKEVRIKAANSVLAQALEHETDHINGTLYVDHLERPEDLHQIAANHDHVDETSLPE
jgi:peptide deformylase